MISHGFADAVGSILATGFVIALLLAFVVGVLVGVFAPEFWQIMKTYIHAVTA